MSIIRSGFIVAFFTLISRVFGLLRELVIANFFGTNLFADAVNTAFKFPNLFRRIFGEGALASAFVPIYSSDLQISTSKAERFASEIYSLLFITLLILTAILEIFMPQVVSLLAPGFIQDPEKFKICVLLCRITMPYMIFISIAALFGGIMNSHSYFASFAFVPILLNIVIIIACLFEGDDVDKSVYIAIAITLGGGLQFGFMYFCTKYIGVNFNFISPKKLSKESYLFLKNMMPATIGSSVTQLNLFVSQAIASFAPGAISILSYSDRIYQFPLSIIGICFGTVLLPTLSAFHKAGKSVEALKLQTDAIKLSFFLSFACVAGIISLAHPIMHVIYERGAFTSADTVKAAETISAFALGLPAFIINKVITPIFYARLDTRTPLKITIATILFNIVANLMLIKNFAHLGIAIGTSLASWFNVVLLIIYSKKSNSKLLTHNISNYLIKILWAAFSMGVILKLITIACSNALYSNSNLLKFSLLVLLVGIGISVYFTISMLLGVITRNDLKKLFQRRAKQ